MSRVGKRPIELPEGVHVSLSGQVVDVKGPKGALSFSASDDVEISCDSRTITVAPRGRSKRARQQWGMARTMIANCVEGVSRGFRKELEINGVGYRAQKTKSGLSLALGFSHEVNIDLPEGISVEVPKATQIIVEGACKQSVGQVAAEIRRWRSPEPFKGKGIRYAGEFVFRKAGKKK